MKSVICFILSLLQLVYFSFVKIGKDQVISVNRYKEYQTFEGFGTSSAWWSQNIDDDATAKETARLLYDKETGLGLRVYRYNIGAGEKDNPDSRIAYEERKTESFYYYDETSGTWKYDFTRDENAVRMMKYAVEYGADQVILFCNSPHYSMTSSGQASGGLESGVNNLPEENYGAFVDYVLTIADHFVEEGIPVKAISPINEPQWGWGGEWVGQEGCHYDVNECVELLELFAVTMQERNCSYELRGPESGQLSEGYYDYIDKFMQSDILRNYCDYYSGHSYWMDNDIQGKTAVGKKFSDDYPDMKFEMSEWCELPLTYDSYSIDSGINMANIIIQDLSLMNAVSWSSWTAVNGDGLLEMSGGTVRNYNRYYAYMHFTRFIKPGAVRIQVMDSKEISSISSVAFKDGNTIVLVLVNNSSEESDFTLSGLHGDYEIYRTDSSHNCFKTESGRGISKVRMPARSIETIVIR